MTAFDDRKTAAEAKFTHDQEFQRRFTISCSSPNCAMLIPRRPSGSASIMPLSIIKTGSEAVLPS